MNRFILELRVEALERKHQNRNAKAPVKASAPTHVNKAVSESTPAPRRSTETSAATPASSFFGRLLGNLVTPRRPDATPKPKSRAAQMPEEAPIKQSLPAADPIPPPPAIPKSAIPTKSLLDHPLLRRASVFTDSSRTDVLRDDTSVKNPLLKRASVFVDPTPAAADLSLSATSVDNPLLRRAPVFAHPSGTSRSHEMAQVPTGKPVSILSGQVSEGTSQHAAAIAALFKDDQPVLRTIRLRASDASLVDASFSSSQGNSSRRSNAISIPRRSTYSARDEQPSVRDMARSFEASIEMEREELEREEQTLSRRKSLNMERPSARR